MDQRLAAVMEDYLRLRHGAKDAHAASAVEQRQCVEARARVSHESTLVIQLHDVIWTAVGCYLLQQKVSKAKKEHELGRFQLIRWGKEMLFISVVRLLIQLGFRMLGSNALTTHVENLYRRTKYYNEMLKALGM